MSFLSDDEKNADLIRREEAVRKARDDIQQFRSALSADRERVRSVVAEIARHVIDSCYYDDRLQARTITVHGEKTTGCVAEVSERIATRAAEQLAGCALRLESSRACEVGTKGCVTRHADSATAAVTEPVLRGLRLLSASGVVSEHPDLVAARNWIVSLRP